MQGLQTAKYSWNILTGDSTLSRRHFSFSRTHFGSVFFSRLLKEVVLKVLKYFAWSCVLQMLGEWGGGAAFTA